MPGAIAEPTMGASLLTRLRAWLGASGPAAARAPAARAGSGRGDRLGEAPPEIEPLDRMTVAQWLWGDGFVVPGSPEYLLDLVKPIGLNPAMSMLDFSAGLGGPARAIAQAFGTYVTGLERSPELARRGMEMSVTANLGKRATVAPYDPETVELRPHSFDGILARGATYGIAEKERLLRVAFQGLKPRGHLLLIEFVVDPKFADRPALAAWQAREAQPAAPWTIAQYSDCMASLGFDIRVVEDITRTYQSMIVDGWARLVRDIDIRSMSRAHKLTIIDEAELWTLQLAALQSGALRIYRAHALANKPSR